MKRDGSNLRDHKQMFIDEGENQLVGPLEQDIRYKINKSTLIRQNARFPNLMSPGRSIQGAAAIVISDQKERTTERTNPN